MREFYPGPRRIARQIKRIEEQKRHEKERREQADGDMELRFGMRRKLGAGELARELGNIEVKICRRYRQVSIIGLYGSQIKPHLEDIKPYMESFSILSTRRDQYYKDPNKTDKSKWSLTFGSKTGLEQYLEFNKWTNVPNNC